ncbi:MAG: S8 family serine peptidase [Deltaproteobacteria bacterium]|nr:S8 family serine peptidase [Deltaproteobacteria bacterium]
MRALSVLGAFLLPLFAACADGPSPASEPPSSLASPLHAPSPDVRTLWEVRLEGRASVDAWLEAPVAARASRSRARLAELAVERRELLFEVERHAEVVGDLRRLVNGLLVHATPAEAARVAELPGVVTIAPAQLFERGLASALPTTGAPKVWTGEEGLHGDGVTIGIIDSGIDYEHADLGGSGSVDDFNANDSTILEPGSFPTARVIGGYDFTGDDYNASNPSQSKPSPDPDPLDCQGSGRNNSGGHGTHVAAIAAGNGVTSDGKAYSGPYDATLALDAFPIAPGVAPRASLVSLRVFGCGGSTGILPLALERAADPNDDGDFADRLDVVNLSLGASYGLGAGFNYEGVTKLSELDSLVVIAAGNDGDTFFDVGSPGTVPAALTVAATEERRWVPLHVETPASLAGTYAAAEGPVSKPLAQVGTLTGALAAATPLKACGKLVAPENLEGKIALVERGDCTFAFKLANVRETGAIGAIVLDDTEAPDPPSMSGMISVDLPAVAVRRELGLALAKAVDEGVTVRLVGGEVYEGLGSNAMAGFSSRGPSPIDLALKPDIAAPGSDIVAARVGTGNGGVSLSGTSMATPVVAGVAALLRQKRPDLGGRALKSVLVGTARPAGGTSGDRYSLTRQGGGVVAADRAIATTLRGRTNEDGGGVGLSFGAIVAATTTSLTRTARFDNDGAEAVALALSIDRVDALPGVTVTLSAPSLTIPPGGFGTVDVTLTLDPSALGDPAPDALTPAQQFEFSRHYLNEAMGFVRGKSGDDEVALPFYAVVRAAADRQVAAVTGCEAPTPTNELRLVLEGTSAHPAPVVTAFELGLIDEEKPKSKTDPHVAATDLRAIGVASDYATKLDLGETTVMFAVTTAGPWTTPAAGPSSPVGILVDSDGKPGFDFVITAAPFSSEQPFADVLVSEVFDDKGKRVGSPRYVNLAPRSDADTAPFLNDVLVLSVNAEDIGLKLTRTAFKYAAYAERIDTPQTDDETGWAEHDIAAPRLDTAALAPKPGRPIVIGGETLGLRVGATTREASEPLRALVLHHSNVPGKRWEAPLLDAPALETLTLTLDERPAAARRVVRRLTVTNTSARAIDGVTLTASVAGATFEQAAPSQGSCADGSIACTLGRLEPGAFATVGLTLVNQSDTPASIEAQVTTKGGCVTTTLGEVPRSTSEAAPALTAAGGCACRVPAAPDDDTNAAWLLATVGGFATLARRRKRR